MNVGRCGRIRGNCGRELQMGRQSGDGLHILTPEASQQRFKELFRMNKKRVRTSSRKKQPIQRNPTPRCTFVNKPLSTTELYE